ncbi:hypothetical protein DVH24_013397 [Malus domestica]|uniref:Uncharacterized protein n=1 Tax=Malus domestica TaxID=3750 RepID=A0A498HNC2_MALDO|nr:hypothetical protein DVH24_013397 [Malus domestica]
MYNPLDINQNIILTLDLANEKYNQFPTHTVDDADIMSLETWFMTCSSQPVCEHIFDFDGDFERTLRRKKKLQESNPLSPEPELEEQEVEVEEEATARFEEEVPTMAADNRTIKELSALVSWE